MISETEAGKTVEEDKTIKSQFITYLFIMALEI